MLTDLLSSDMYVSFNIKVAHRLGLEEAVYLAELLNIYNKAVQKNKLKDNFLTLDRKYMTKRTTLSENTQLRIEADLDNIHLIKIGVEKNQLQPLIDNFTGLVLDTDEKLVTTLVSTSSKKMTKKEAISMGLKNHIRTTSEELKAQYNEWIDAVLSKFNWLSKKAVIEAQDVVDNYANHNLDVALKIVDIAATNGYKDMTWAINNFERNFKRKYVEEAQGAFQNAPPERTTLSSEVF